MSAAGGNDHAGAGHSCGPGEEGLDASTWDASTRVGDRVGDEQARLNAARLSLAERWRRALGEPDATEIHAGSAPLVARGEELEEFWEAREMCEVWAQAEQDPALLAMLREDQADALGSEPLDPAALTHARARFQSRMRQEAPSALPETSALPTIAGADAQAPGLTVSEVVEAMEQEAQLGAPRGQAGRADAWRAALEPVRASRQPLPAPITTQAMRAFWNKMGVAVPREVSTAFNQAARLLLMGRAGSSAPLSLAREARPSGISEAVARLALESATDEEAPAQPEPKLDQPELDQPAREPAARGGDAAPEASSSGHQPGAPDSRG